MSKRILILAANPRDSSRLRLDEEIREIRNGLQRASRREDFGLEQRLAARPKDVRRAMLDFKPNIVHFCGHGSGDAGIAFEDEAGNTRLVSAEALAGLFELFKDTVECVVLNACYSEVQAEAIAEHIKYVVGMKKGIGDTAAIEFAGGFYDALGAGESVEFAYGLARNAIQWTDTPHHLIPILKLTASSTERTSAGAGTPSLDTLPHKAVPSALQLHETEALREWVRILGRWTATQDGVIYIGPDNPNTTQPYGILLSNTRMREGVVQARIRFPEQPCAGRVLFGYRSPTGPYFTVGIGGYGHAYVLDDFRPTVGWQAFKYSGIETDIAISADYQIEVEIKEPQVVLRVNGIEMIRGAPPRGIELGQIGLFAWGRKKVEFRDFRATPA